MLGKLWECVKVFWQDPLLPSDPNLKFGNVASNSCTILPNRTQGAAPRTPKLPTFCRRNQGPQGARNNVHWVSPQSKPPPHLTRFGNLGAAAARLITHACQKPAGRSSCADDLARCSKRVESNLPKNHVTAAPARITPARRRRRAGLLARGARRRAPRAPRSRRRGGADARRAGCRASHRAA